MDLKNGKILNLFNLKGWENFNIKNYLSEKLNLFVKVNNDVNVVGFVESLVGSGKDCEFVFYIIVFIGVGGVLIFDKKIINGVYS